MTAVDSYAAMNLLWPLLYPPVANFL